MRIRSSSDPLLLVSDGAPGSVKAIETCFTHSARQRCLTHRMRELAEGLARGCEAGLPRAVAYLRDDFEACIPHLRMPATHCRAVRTTNLLGRLFVEERWRAIKVPGFARR